MIGSASGSWLEGQVGSNTWISGCVIGRADEAGLVSIYLAEPHNIP